MCEEDAISGPLSAIFDCSQQRDLLAFFLIPLKMVNQRNNYDDFALCLK
ncbi:MAG: hypothetical protein QMB42_04180 [SAR324 cluster bacterium]|jgi:hypothetical protein